MNYKETYQEWLSNPYFDEDTKNELKNFWSYLTLCIDIC